MFTLKACKDKLHQSRPTNPHSRPPSPMVHTTRWDVYTYLILGRCPHPHTPYISHSINSYVLRTTCGNGSNSRIGGFLVEWPHSTCSVRIPTPWLLYVFIPLPASWWTRLMALRSATLKLCTKLSYSHVYHKLEYKSLTFLKQFKNNLLNKYLLLILFLLHWSSKNIFNEFYALNIIHKFMMTSTYQKSLPFAYKTY